MKKTVFMLGLVASALLFSCSTENDVSVNDSVGRVVPTKGGTYTFADSQADAAAIKNSSELVDLKYAFDQIIDKMDGEPYTFYDKPAFIKFITDNPDKTKYISIIEAEDDYDYAQTKLELIISQYGSFFNYLNGQTLGNFTLTIAPIFSGPQTNNPPKGTGTCLDACIDADLAGFAAATADRDAALDDFLDSDHDVVDGIFWALAEYEYQQRLQALDAEFMSCAGNCPE